MNTSARTVAAGFAAAVLTFGGMLATLSAAADPVEGPAVGVLATIAMSEYPSAVAVDSVLGRLYVANPSNSALAVFDTATNELVASVNMDVSPRAIALDEASHTVYVLDASTSDLTVIDGTNNTIITTVALGGSPRNLAVRSTNESGPAHTVYVTNDDDAVIVIDGDTLTVTTGVPVSGGPLDVAADQNTGLVYVTSAFDSTVSVIDPGGNTVTATIPVGAGPRALAVDGSAGLAYVINHLDSTVSVIDLLIDLVVATIPVNGDPVGIAVDEATHTVYVTNSAANAVTLIEGATNTITNTVAVGMTPIAVSVDRLTGWAYVANGDSETISVLALITPDVATVATAAAVVSAGDRSAQLGDVSMTAVPYAHDDRVSTTSTTLSVDDGSGSAAGWAVTTEASSFVWSSPGGSAADAADIAAANLAVTSVGEVSTVSGQAWAADPVPVTGALNSPVTVLTAAADTGQGSYTLPVNLSFTIPGTSHAGTYTATLTTTLAVAP